MRVAQKLYEGIAIGAETVGLITYMRTDGVQMANEAIAGCRELIARRLRPALPARRSRAIYKSKAKNAQEAHEAIRPTDVRRTAGGRRPLLDRDQQRAVHADLEADARQPDGVGRSRSGRRRHRLARSPGDAPRHRLGHRL